MTVHLKQHEEVALLTLDRPNLLNALSFEVIYQLTDAFREVAKSRARALFITGAGTKAFCAGADISELMGRSLEEEKAATERGQRCFALLDELPIPSVAIINGYALGGGLELALACTFRLAAPGASMGLPEIKMSLVPGYGGTQRLPRLIGESRALEMILTGRRIDAGEALSIGLVNRIIEGDPLAAALAFSREFTGFGLPALLLARQAVQRGMRLSLRDGLLVEADLSTLSMRTEDGKEGVNAFLEKRPPIFRDR